MNGPEFVGQWASIGATRLRDEHERGYDASGDPAVAQTRRDVTRGQAEPGDAHARDDTEADRHTGDAEVPQQVVPVGQ